MCLNVSGEVESTNGSEQYLHKPRSDMECYLLFLLQVHWSTTGRLVETLYEISNGKKRQALATKLVAPRYIGGSGEKVQQSPLFRLGTETKDNILIGTQMSDSELFHLSCVRRQETYWWYIIFKYRQLPFSILFSWQAGLRHILILPSLQAKRARNWLLRPDAQPWIFKSFEAPGMARWES